MVVVEIEHNSGGVKIKTISSVAGAHCCLDSAISWVVFLPPRVIRFLLSKNLSNLSEVSLLLPRSSLGVIFSPLLLLDLLLITFLVWF